MGEFQPIETQEQLNEVIKDRIARERAKYADYDDLKAKAAAAEKTESDYKGQIDGYAAKAAEYEKKIAEQAASIRGFQTRETKLKTAHELGLGYEAVDFLQGDDEESIRKSAEALKSLVGVKKTAPAFVADEGVVTDQKSASLRALAKSIGAKN